MDIISMLLITINVVCSSYTYKVEPERDQALIYLSRFGYLDNVFESNQLLDGSVVRNAISDFQAFAGLEVTGLLNAETVKKMSQPRCGVKDKVGTGNDYRSRRYALQGSRWRLKDIKYKVSKYPKRFSQKNVDQTFAKAFRLWSDETDLTFTVSKEDANIDIRFESSEHGDETPFDGPGGTLAHAYFPGFGGNVHFDASEDWSMDFESGTNLLQVAAHEFGHALGLGHSDIYKTLMKPFYDHSETAVTLEKDDIEAIQSLYGKKLYSEEKLPTTTEIPISTDDPILCKDPKIDTIFTNEKGMTFVFKGGKYWQLDNDGILEGYPKSISQRWPGLSGPVDAAVTYNNGKTFFFKRDEYYVYIGYTLVTGFPKKISKGFPGIPNDVDTALVWSGNGKLYFFKGSKFWRFDPHGKPKKVKSSYPKKLTYWNGIPDNIDAAFRYTNERTYFFKGDQYYQFNDTEFAAESSTYPKSTRHWWFKCDEAPAGTIDTL